MDFPKDIQVLGIAGNTKSGKDTLANFLAEEFGCTVTHFADSFKNILKGVFAFSDDQLWGKSKNVPDERYVFSGTCPLDHAQCEWSDVDSLWHCPTCSNTYQKFLTPRFTMHTLGTEWGRTMYGSVWTEMTLRNILETFHKTGNTRFVIADLRFREEVEQVKQVGGIVVRIKRDIPLEHAWHATEAELLTLPDSMFQSVVDNNGTLDDLKKQAHEIGSQFFHA